MPKRPFHNIYVMSREMDEVRGRTSKPRRVDDEHNHGHDALAAGLSGLFLKNSVTPQRTTRTQVSKSNSLALFGTSILDCQIRRHKYSRIVRQTADQKHGQSTA